MPVISRRGTEMPSSPIRKLVPYAEAAKKRGVKIYHLNIGQPDIATPPQAFEAVRNADIKVLEYSHSAGFESYRRKLVGYYETFGAKLDFNDIIITTGGSEALMFALLSTMDEGDEVIIPEPFYANYNGFARAGSIVVKPVTSYIGNNFALPDIKAFEDAITPRTRGIMINNPGNPTGYLYTDEELMQLRDLVIKHNLFLFSDEVYREFVYDGKKFRSVLTLDGLDQHAIVIDSISKRYSACGARIGALVTRNKDVINASMKFAQARLSPPTLEQILAEATVDVEASYLTEVNKEYDQRRQTMVAGLQAIKGVVCPRPGGAFYVLCELPIDDSDVFCQWMLESFQYEGATVMMAPGTGFYATPGLGKKEVRLAYVLKEEDIRGAVACLEKALEVYPGRTV